ncbi:MAG: hypothetical protein FWC06_02960 [Treponema sp.]|nr:hypothetical protein [Treponema sp.]
MTDPELLQALDYILNRSDEAAVDVLVEAVTRRKRDLTVFNVIGGMPNPQKMAKEITERIDSGISASIDGIRNSVQEMAIRILREHAPELNDKQINELCLEWLPNVSGKGASDKSAAAMPPDVLLSMIEQFISFSNSEMSESVDNSLRNEMGAWPERYWNSFPPVVRQIITDYLKNKTSEKDFKSKIILALGI